MAPTAVKTSEKGIELDDEMRAYVRGISRHLARGDSHLAEDIEQMIAETTLPPGGYRLVAQTRGEAYRGEFEVEAGELVACDLR